MKLKTLFQCGASIVLPVPKEYREALRWVKGTQVICRIENKRLIVEKALITGAGGPPADAPGRES